MFALKKAKGRGNATPLTPYYICVCSLSDCPSPYRLGFIVFHSATGGTMPRLIISSRIFSRCSYDA